MITGMMDRLPRMLEVRQLFPASPDIDFAKQIGEQFLQSGIQARIVPGMKVAVGVGSRGIANLDEIVRTVLILLHNAGAKPFLVPAMGSHGGATPDGQLQVLEEYGITPALMEVPFEAGMEVEEIGTDPFGTPIVFSAAALKADAVIVINRIKPHTDFQGDLGSGLQKMLVIGFGKHVGAATTHAAAVRIGHEAAIRRAAKVILDKVPVLCGVALLEDQHHRTSKVCVIDAAHIPEREDQLLAEARCLMPRLPLDAIDLLIVDQLGKEISGTGMDTNVIGRGVFGYVSSLNASTGVKPHISRIFVRDLSRATNGNGLGIGLADFTTTRLVKALDLKYVYTNALTSLGLACAKIPMYFDTDREAIGKAIESLATARDEKIRVVRILDTLNLGRLLISESLVELLQQRPNLEIIGKAKEFAFDELGNLRPF